MPPLAVPPVPRISSYCIDAYGAVQLFVYRAGSIQPGFELTAKIAFGGANLSPPRWPAAGARVGRKLPQYRIVEQLEAELAQTSRILVHGRRTAPARHRSLETTH